MSAKRIPCLLVVGTMMLFLVQGCVQPGSRGPMDPGGEVPADVHATPTAPNESAVVARLGPGSHHRHLDAIAGRWSSTITVWPRPGAEGNSSEGVSDLQWILNGCWLRQDYRASDGSEEAARGLGLIGYDYVREEHVFVWVDNMSCCALQSTGKCEEDGRTTILAGWHGDPLSGERSQRFRWVVRVMDQNRWTLELYDTALDGREFRKLEIRNIRATPPPITAG